MPCGAVCSLSRLAWTALSAPTALSLYQPLLLPSLRWRLPLSLPLPKERGTLRLPLLLLKPRQPRNPNPFEPPPPPPRSDFPSGGKTWPSPRNSGHTWCRCCPHCRTRRKGSQADHWHIWCPGLGLCTSRRLAWRVPHLYLGHRWTNWWRPRCVGEEDRAKARPQP